MENRGGFPVLWSTASNYAREIFLLMVTPLYITECRGVASYEGGPRIFALPLNLQTQQELQLDQKFAEISLHDWKAILLEINHIFS